ncbi:hypothetical protein [Blautia sp. Marseille-P3201T]|uniref:hypothetical protein n=1 Tax=Blautia sp. Marseille-P3201T TaxID=1907659 RepID=UPI00093036D7|nr:hypothetical protein [Blautia sp. Marseille-P3201T]
MGEIKQANFRVRTEDADKFRAFCEEEGFNQAQGFDHIMQIVELDRAKASVPARMTEIEEFERHVKSMLAAYLNSLEIAEATEERILEQFQGKLDSKDQIIMDLQNSLDEREGKLEEAQAALKEAENKVISAEKEATEAKEKLLAAEQVVEDKKSIADMLAAQLRDAEQKVKDYPELQARLEEAKNEVKNSQQLIKDMEKDAEIQKERAVNEIGLKLSRAEASSQEKAEQIEKLEQKIEELRASLDTAKETIAVLKAMQKQE